jgi:hypothetical protein
MEGRGPVLREVENGWNGEGRSARSSGRCGGVMAGRMRTKGCARVVAGAGARTREKGGTTDAERTGQERTERGATLRRAQTGGCGCGSGPEDAISRASQSFAVHITRPSEAPTKRHGCAESPWRARRQCHPISTPDSRAPRTLRTGHREEQICHMGRRGSALLLLLHPEPLLCWWMRHVVCKCADAMGRESLVHGAHTARVDPRVGPSARPVR